MLLAPVVRGQKGEFRDVIERLSARGFRSGARGRRIRRTRKPEVRVKLDAKASAHHRSGRGPPGDGRQGAGALAGFGGDGVAVGRGSDADAASSLRVESRESRAEVAAQRTRPLDTHRRLRRRRRGSKRSTPTACISPATGKSYEPLTPKHFSFNAPSGACPVCHGLGQKMVFDEGLVVPDPEKSLEQGAVLPWRRGGKRMVVYYKAMLRAIGRALRPESGKALQGFAGRFQKDLASRFGRNGNRVSLLARGQEEHGQAAVRGRVAEHGAALRRERKRVHAQPAQGVHESAVLRCVRRASG